MSGSNTRALRPPFGTLGPASIDFINRPNPVEPQSVPERHPLHDAQRFKKTTPKQDQLSHFLNPAPVIPSEPVAKRQRVGDGPGQHLDLPRLPVRSSLRKPRLPPTLSGLHQPPPDARVLPSINVEQPPNAGSKSALAQITRPPAPADVAKVYASSSKEAPDESSLPEVSPKGHESEPSSKAKQKQRHPRAQRRKWSDEETAHLLTGVAKYGIGNWTKILRDDSFSFNNRTALDLKDRFRVCCPDQYKHGSTQSNPVVSGGTYTGSPPPQVSNKKKRGVRPERKSTAELESMGFPAPFAEASHRQKPEYTSREDEALLKGFNEYGKRWALIRNDTALGLSHRSAPDLRDRFRSRFPHEYDSSTVNTTAHNSAPEEISGNRGRKSNVEKARDAVQNLERIGDATAEHDLNGRTHDHNSTGNKLSHRVSQVALNMPSDDDIFFGLPFDSDIGDVDSGPIILDRQILDFGRSRIAGEDFMGQRLPQMTMGNASVSTALPSLAAITAANGSDGIDQIELPSLIGFAESTDSDMRNAGHAAFPTLEELLS